MRKLFSRKPRNEKRGVRWLLPSKIEVFGAMAVSSRVSSNPPRSKNPPATTLAAMVSGCCNAGLFAMTVTGGSAVASGGRLVWADMVAATRIAVRVMSDF